LCFFFLFSRVIDAHAASTSDNHSTTASIDLIAYTWVSPGQEIFSLPTTFSLRHSDPNRTISISFQDFFDLILPDETPIIGLTDHELNRIPTITYIAKTSEDKCAVCLNEYINGDILKYLKCKHYFHSECINPWLKVNLWRYTFESFSFVFRHPLDVQSVEVNRQIEYCLMKSFLSFFFVMSFK
jgi:hypothetical protein